MVGETWINPLSEAYYARLVSGWVGTVKFAILKTRGHSIVACGITRCTAKVCGVIPLKTRVSTHAVIGYVCIELPTMIPQDFRKAPMTVVLMTKRTFQSRDPRLNFENNPI